MKSCVPSGASFPPHQVFHVEIATPGEVLSQFVADHGFADATLFPFLLPIARRHVLNAEDREIDAWTSSVRAPERCLVDVGVAAAAYAVLLEIASR